MKLVLRTIQFNNKRRALRGTGILSQINISSYLAFPQQLVMKSLRFPFSSSK